MRRLNAPYCSRIRKPRNDNAMIPIPTTASLIRDVVVAPSNTHGATRIQDPIRMFKACTERATSAIATTATVMTNAPKIRELSAVAPADPRTSGATIVQTPNTAATTRCHGTVTPQTMDLGAQ